MRDRLRIKLSGGKYLGKNAFKPNAKLILGGLGAFNLLQFLCLFHC